jgi:hypothetical protein
MSAAYDDKEYRMKVTLAPVLAGQHVAATVDVVATPAIASQVTRSRRVRSPEALLILFFCGVVACVTAVTSLAGGGTFALIATIALVLLFTAVILGKTLSLLSGDGG